MRGQPFDPIAVERAMVAAGALPVRADSPDGALGELEQHFLENDPHAYALWRISMVRQLQPAVLRRLTADDLLYLAGQSAEGYLGREAFGIHLDRNKITQNALRARVELDVRATRGAWRRTVLLAAGSLVLGALLTLLPTWIRG